MNNRSQALYFTTLPPVIHHIIYSYVFGPSPYVTPARHNSIIIDTQLRLVSRTIREESLDCLFRRRVSVTSEQLRTLRSQLYVPQLLRVVWIREQKLIDANPSLVREVLYGLPSLPKINTAVIETRSFTLANRASHVRGWARRCGLGRPVRREAGLYQLGRITLQDSTITRRHLRVYTTPSHDDVMSMVGGLIRTYDVAQTLRLPTTSHTCLRIWAAFCGDIRERQRRLESPIVSSEDKRGKLREYFQKLMKYKLELPPRSYVFGPEEEHVEEAEIREFNCLIDQFDRWPPDGP